MRGGMRTRQGKGMRGGMRIGQGKCRDGMVENRMQGGGIKEKVEGMVYSIREE